MSTFHWIAVTAVIITSSARLTRLATWDEFPPAKALRERYAAWADKTDRRRPWQLLAYCGYCASFWVTVLVEVAAYLCGVLGYAPLGDRPWLATAWWFTFGTLGMAYLAAIIMAYDGDDGDEG